MRYFLDTEFNGFGGALISLALVREDGASVYLVWDDPVECDPWVKAFVLPLVGRVPPHVDTTYAKHTSASDTIRTLLSGDRKPVIISDWPDDIRYLCERLITGPGEMIPTPETIRFEVRRVDAYPSKLLGAIQHNAWWDAMALRFKLTGKQTTKRRIYGEHTMHAGTCWVPA